MRLFRLAVELEIRGKRKYWPAGFELRLELAVLALAFLYNGYAFDLNGVQTGVHVYLLPANWRFWHKEGEHRFAWNRFFGHTTTKEVLMSRVARPFPETQSFT